MPYAKKGYLEAVWIQFAESGKEELPLDCGSEKAARGLRFALYATARPVKKRPELNPKLAAAVEQVSLRIDEANPHVLVMYREECSPLVKMLVAQLGLDLGKRDQDMRQEATESAQRVLAQLGVAQLTPRAQAQGNPYYTRERPQLEGTAPQPPAVADATPPRALPLPPDLLEGAGQ